MFPFNNLIDEMPRLRKFSLRLTHNVSDADDLLQATLLRAMEKNNLFQDNTDLYKWTSRIMFNLFVTQYRRRTKFESRYDPEPFISRQSVSPVQEDYTDLSMLQDCLEKLRPEQREILSLTCLRDFTYEDAADYLHIPVGTVRSRLGRARANLNHMTHASHGMPAPPPALPH